VQSPHRPQGQGCHGSSRWSEDRVGRRQAGIDAGGVSANSRWLRAKRATTGSDPWGSDPGRGRGTVVDKAVSSVRDPCRGRWLLPTLTGGIALARSTIGYLPRRLRRCLPSPTARRGRNQTKPLPQRHRGHGERRSFKNRSLRDLGVSVVAVGLLTATRMFAPREDSRR